MKYCTCLSWSYYYVLREFVVPENIPKIIEGLRMKMMNKLDSHAENYVNSLLSQTVLQNEINQWFDRQYLSIKHLRKVGLTGAQVEDLTEFIQKNQNISYDDAKEKANNWIKEFIRKVPIASNRVPPAYVKENFDENIVSRSIFAK